MTPLRNKLGKWKILRGEKITPLGIPLMSYAGDILVVLEVLIDFAGDRKILCRGRSFRGFWLRITQLYPVKEITL